MPEIFVFAGCNGSGKSTLARRFLDSLSPSPEFVNADEIAAQLNPDNVEAVAIAASRQMLTRLRELAAKGENFAFETTLAARTFAPFLKSCQAKGYTFNLIYTWLDSPKLATNRVADRVRLGGHNIPTDTIVRRYYRSIGNFINMYSLFADSWIVFDNSYNKEKIAEKPLKQSIVIYKPSTWQKLNESIYPR